MSGVNKVILIGRLGKNPETHVFENGSKKVSFSLATSESYRDKDGNRKELTEWHLVVCWRNLADIAEKYLVKGRLIYLEGRLRSRTWDDANGVKRTITEIEATNFTMLGAKEGAKPTEQQVEQAEPVSFTDVSAGAGPNDVLPF